MSDINDSQRQALKQQAARMAITDANLSQYLAGAAATFALISPNHAAVLALGAAAMGVCGNYRQQVANDPPRADYAQVWVSGATFEDPQAGGDEALLILQRFAGQVLLVCDAHFALLRAIERYDGAANAGDDAAKANQAEAAAQNANRVSDLQEALIPLSNELAVTVEGLRDGRGFDQTSLADTQALYRQAWGRPPDAPGNELQRIAGMIAGAADDLYEPFDPVQAHPIMSAEAMPADDASILTGEWLAGLNENNVTLRAFVDM